MRIQRLLILPGIMAALALVPEPCGAIAPGHGGGRIPTPPSGINCIPADPASLPGTGALPQAPPAAAGLVLYTDPMGGGINSFGQTVVNYVDLTGVGLLDWNCGAVTYDGHQGIDVEIPSFYHMDEMTTPVLTAAPGTVTAAHDGEFDRRTAWQSGALANYAIVTHADGSRALYYHFKKGSVRVSPGQPVAAGDTLGFVGSSGFSTGPHLHFETQDAGAREPYAGPCNADPSRWITQDPYVWNLPFQLFGHGLTTLALNWPTIQEWPPSKTHVTAGGTVYSWIRPRNLLSTNLLTWRFYANDVLWTSYNWYPSGSYQTSWWYVVWTLPVDLTLYGNWRIDILRDGVLMAQQFFTYDAVPNRLPIVPRRNYWVAVDGSLTTEFEGNDPDGSIFWYEVTMPPSNGRLEVFGGRRRKFVYEPDPGFYGLDSIYVRAQDDQGVWSTPSRIKLVVGLPLDVPAAPAEPVVSLSRPAPNPVTSQVVLAYSLPRAAGVSLELYDVAGQRVATLESGAKPAGEHRLSWRARRDNGTPLPAGIYFLALSADGERVTRRMVIAR